MALPDFLIIGAMKCGTSTLQAQLAASPGIFMTTPKEPNFFSDDDVFEKGLDWYEDLFALAAPDDLTGEASTHYTKLPLYPQALPRLAAHLDNPKLIYMIRNPVARAASHYVHEWTMGNISTGPDAALTQHTDLIDFGCYGRQIAPYVERYGADRILVLSLEDMKRVPQETLGAVGAFLEYLAPLIWQDDLGQVNAGKERVRRFPLHGLLFDNPLATGLRRALVPQSLRDRIKSTRQMTSAPEFSPESVTRLHEVFAKDRAMLCDMFPHVASMSATYPFAET